MVGQHKDPKDPLVWCDDQKTKATSLAKDVGLRHLF